MAVKRWSGTAWEVYAGADVVPVKVTDGRVGKTTFIGATSPTGQVDGDIWIDQDTTTNAVVPTALTTKGDTFVATGNAAYTRLAAGSNGESLYADSSSSTGLRWQGDYNAGKNKVLNGAFDVWQRGATFNNPVSDTGFLADRFYSVHNGSGATRTITRETFTPGSAPVAGYESQYFLRYNVSNIGTGNTYQYITTSIEDVRIFAGQPITFSFWAKANTNINVGWNVDQFFGSGGSAVNYNAAGYPQSTFNLTTSWQRFTATGTMQSISGRTIGSNSYLRLFIALPANQNLVVDTWGWQLEAGSVATPFTTNTGNQALELAACQRYFQALSWGPTYNTAIHSGHFWSSTKSLGTVHLKTTMRGTPSVVISSPSHVTVYSANATYAVSSIGVDALTAASFDIEFVTSSAGTAGYGTFNRITNSSGYLWISAEL